MVTRGQFLERPTLIPVGSGVLEGLWHRGAKLPPLLILSPPWAEGGSMDHVLVAELAWASAQAGHASLRFNYRGVGASQGSRSGEWEQTEDVLAAMSLLQENTGAPQVALAALGGAFSTVRRVLEKAAPLVAGVVQLSASDRPVGPPLSNVPQLQVTVDPEFRKGLPQAGRTVAEWLEQLSASQP